jgi:hypothetical protein
MGLPAPESRIADTIHHHGRRLRVYLALALLLCFLAVWKGEPHRGYADIGDYFDMSEGLWLRGDMSFVDAPTGEVRYRRYPVGLAVISGPFVLAGHALQNLTHGAIGQRSVIALLIPLLTVGSGLLLVAIGRALGCSARASLWTALLFALASPVLTFVRLYYCDTVVVFYVLLAAWAALQTLRAPPASAWKWALLSGAALAGMAITHYGAGAMALGCWLAMSASVLRSRQLQPRRRVAIVATLSAVPLLAGLALLAMNQQRFGSPFRTGYDVVHPGRFSLIGLDRLDKNATCLLLFGWRTPWVILGLWGLWLGVRRRATRALFAIVLVALVSQMLFWLVFRELLRFPLRYPLPMLALLAVGLLLAAQEIARRWPQRGFVYGGIIAVCWNMFYFIRGEDIWPSFFIDTRRGTALLCHVWYMTPLSQQNARVWGTPVGLAQATALSILLAGGVLFFVLAWRQARSLDSQNAAETAAFTA